MVSVLHVWALACASAWATSPARLSERPPRLSERSVEQRYQSWVARQSEPEHNEAYRFVPALHQSIAPLARNRPGVIQPMLIGRSVERRPIWGFRIRRPGQPVHTKVLVFAGIHALEWITSETAVEFIQDTVRQPPKGVEVVVVPLLNPDGRERAQDDRLAGENRYRRANARGVDLNRDFAVNTEAKAVWKAIIPAYYGRSQSPLSQPESQALDALLAAEQFDVAISLHAFGGFFYTPWSGLWKRPEDWSELHRLGTVMSEAQGSHAYKVRQLARWGFFFRAHGSEIDHIYGRYGTLAFLVEITRSGVTPFRPRSMREYFQWYNPPNPERHTLRTVRALRSLVHTLDWEARSAAIAGAQPPKSRPKAAP